MSKQSLGTDPNNLENLHKSESADKEERADNADTGAAESPAADNEATTHTVAPPTNRMHKSSDENSVKTNTTMIIRISDFSMFLMNSLFLYIGTANVIRLPIEIYKNGAAFIIIYCLMFFVVALPLQYAEACFGQFTSAGSFGYSGFCLLIKGTGISIALINFLETVLFNQICSYYLLYFVSSLAEKPAWCEEWSECYERIQNNNPNSTANYTGVNLLLDHPARKFFKETMYPLENETFNYKNYICLLFTSFSMWACSLKYKGKRILRNKLLPVLFIIGYLLIFVLLIHCSGPEYNRQSPNISDKLLSIEVWISAANMVYVNICTLGVIAVLASYNSFHFDLMNTVFIGGFFDLVTGVILMFLAFGYENKFTEVCKDEHILNNEHPEFFFREFTDVVFIAYPLVFSTFDIPALWGALFYLMCYIFSLTSVIVMAESLAINVMDIVPWTRIYKERVVLCVCLALFCLAIPFNVNGDLFLLWDKYARGATASSIYIVWFIFLSWVYGADNALADIEFMRGTGPVLMCIPWRCMRAYLNVMWRFVYPFSQFVFFVFAIYNGEFSLDQARAEYNFLKLLLLCAPVVVFTTSVIFQLVKAKGSFWERIKSTAKPAPTWGPADYKVLIQWEDKIKRSQ